MAHVSFVSGVPIISYISAAKKFLEAMGLNNPLSSVLTGKDSAHYMCGYKGHRDLTG